MDMTMLDVAALPDVRVGDEVVLIGSQGAETLAVEDLAKDLDTSPYEAFCDIAARVPRLNLY